MTVNIHGKEYKTVAERVNDAHDKAKGKLSISTDLVSWEDGVVIVKATIDMDGNIFTGHAYEREDSTQINRTSALENCETSAIGRALAAAGFGGTEYASANEVENAVHQQSKPKTLVDEARARKSPAPEKEAKIAANHTPASDKQKGMIWHLAKEKLPKGDDDGRKAYLEGLLKEDSPCPVVADSLSALTVKQASALIDYLGTVV
jgi:hypothetical protein